MYDNDDDEWNDDDLENEWSNFFFFFFLFFFILCHRQSFVLTISNFLSYLLHLPRTGWYVKFSDMWKTFLCIFHVISFSWLFSISDFTLLWQFKIFRHSTTLQPSAIHRFMDGNENWRRNESTDRKRWKREMSENHHRKNGVSEEVGKRKETMKIYNDDDDDGGYDDGDDRKSGNGKSTLNYIKKWLCAHKIYVYVHEWRKKSIFQRFCFCSLLPFSSDCHGREVGSLCSNIITIVPALHMLSSWKSWVRHKTHQRA